MKSYSFSVLYVLLSGVIVFSAPASSAKRTPKEALQAFNDLIGSWRCTGYPEGTREEKRRGFWTESMSWEWRFKGKDAWLKVDFDKGKHFINGELHYLPEKDAYQFKLQTTAKEELTFAGSLKEKRLTLERTDDKKKETQRLLITFLHSNRFLYQYEVKAKDQVLFAARYQVGATKEGVPFAEGEDSGPECVVSGGHGTIKVSYKSETYYVCCTGCRNIFNEVPEQCLKEYRERKAKEAKEKRK